jgi:hypothetical protein
VTRDTAGNPGGDGARGPRRPSDRRRSRAGAQEHAPDEPAGPWATGLTGPQRAFPVWDGVPGYEFEGRRAAPRPPVPGQWNDGRRNDGQRNDAATGPRQFRYTPTIGRPAAPGFEFDAQAQTEVPPHWYSPEADRAEPAPTPATRAEADRPAPRGARAEWARLVRSFLPEPVKRSWFRDFRAALTFRGAGVRVIIPILSMIVFGVAVAVIAGANNSHAGPAPPPEAVGFPPATLAGNAFAAAPGGRGISQTLGRVASDGAEIVAVGSQQGARIARAQFFVSADDGRSWSMGRVQALGGGPPPPGYAARFVAGGSGQWVALGPGSIWTSPDGRTWTLSSTTGLPLRPGDQIDVLKRTASGFIAAGSNATAGQQATPVIFLSANGISWQRIGAGPLQLATSPGSRVLDISYAAVSGNRILIAGDVTATQSVGKPRHPVTVQTGAAWLSGDGGRTWTLVVPPSLPQKHAAHGAQPPISGVVATNDGFALLRPATVAGKPAVDVFRSANGTTWAFAATLGTPAGFVTGMVNGSPDGAVVTGQAGQALIAFASPDGATWRRTPAFGAAATQDTSGVAVAQDGAVVTAGTTTDDPDSRQPVLTVQGTSIDIAKIPGAEDPELAVNDVAAGNGTQVAVGSANGYPAAWVSANGGSTWTRAAGQTPDALERPGVQQLTSVTYGPDGWLAVGGVIAVAAEHPVVLASGNGSIWAAADREPAFSPPGLVTEQAAADQTGYVIVGDQTVAGRTFAAAWWSAGLTGWQRAAGAISSKGASQRMLAVTAGPRGFVAVGSSGNAAAAWTSPDGRAWTQQNVPLPYGATRAVLQHVASNGRTVVAIGTALTTAGQQLPFAASSADGGATWAESSLPVPAGRAFVTALTAAGSGFLATGTFGSTPGHQDVVVWTSSTGMGWKAATPAGQGLTGTGIQAITGLDVFDGTMSGVGFTATPAGEQPVFWQSPVR